MASLDTDHSRSRQINNAIRLRLKAFLPQLSFKWITPSAYID